MGPMKDLIPPILRRAIRHALYCRPQYPHYAAARLAAQDGQSGYESADLVSVVIEKTKRYRPTLPVDANSLAAFLLSRAGPIHVLDFGGAAGAHYVLARAILPATQCLKWVVVETPEMSRRAQAEVGGHELQFVSTLNEARALLPHVDLLYTSGALQCVPDPREILRALLDVGADVMMLQRLALSRGKDVFTVHESRLGHNGPGPIPEGFKDRVVRYPCVFMRESNFWTILEERYAVVSRSEDVSGIFPVKGARLVGYSVIAKRQHA